MRDFKFAVAILALLLTSPLTAPRATAQADVEKRVDSILSKMTLEEKIDYIGGYQDFYIRAIPRIGLPAFKMSDGPIGVRNYGPATTLAGGIALAATWDTDVVRRAGTVLGEDARARGVHILLGPGVNIHRAPMNGRNFEYFGEDPFLAAHTAVSYVEGVQSQGVCATIKHFMGNNSEFDRHNTDSLVDERTMREIYLPTFEAAVKEAHVCAIMDSYNLTNGQHMTQNEYLNTEVAKKDWGFDGIIMSDWDSTYDGIAAVNGGLDLEMPSGEHMNRATLLPAIKAGKVSEATIDDHVRRILRKAIQFGWLDHEQTDTSIPLYNLEGRAVALDAARSSMVLLKNQGNLLPLDKSKVKTIAVVGPDAYPAQPVGGGSAGVHPFSSVSYLEGIAGYAGKDIMVTYNSGLPSLSELAMSTDFVTETSGGKPGLKAEHFKSKDLGGKPYEVITSDHVSSGWDWGGYSGLSPEARSARWTGYYVAKDEGDYEVFLQGPAELGGSRLYFDDKLLLDNWTRATALVNCTPLHLAAGPHKVRLEFFRGYGNPDIRLGIVNTASVVKAEVKALASKADVVVLAVGFDPDSESEGADRTFRLPPGQDELIHEVLAANKNVIVVVTSGGAVDANAWIDQVPALLQSWYSGQEGGTALAQLLFGQYSPSGKLPISFDRHFEDDAVFNLYYPSAGTKQVKYTEGVFVGYRHYDRSATKPLFSFGFGLSYTTFKYSNLVVTPNRAGGDDLVTVSFDVTNSGDREGAEVAELYVSDSHASVPRPVKELKGFAKVDLTPGETRNVIVKLDRRAFSYYDATNKQWRSEPGDFGILVGGSSDKTELQGTFKLTN
jgi:beta-glucosidase